MNSVSAILARPFQPKLTLTAETKKTFRIQMVNSFLNSHGRICKQTKLESLYERKFDLFSPEVVGITDYTWQKATFGTKVKGSPMVPVDWSFAEGVSFSSVMPFNYEKLLAGVDQHSLEDAPFHSIEEALMNLPKMPTVYLLVMQILDVFAFEAYMSYIHTHFASNPEGWKIGEKVLINQEALNNLPEAKIGFGLYSDNSVFKNGKLYFTFMGYGQVKDQVCAIFDYYCDNSIVQVQALEKDASKEGTSHYLGNVWMNIETGEVERGTMLEDYIALQKDISEIPVFTRRKVIMESL